jgi:hypothetical protein
MVIYDAEGNAIDRLPIDARECVESGSYFYERPSLTKPAKPAKPEKTDG